LNEIRSSFIEALDSQDKKRAVEICIDALDSGSIEVVDLYLEILGPALGNWECDYESDRMCIWNEHIRSSIVRTVMECCYPYIIGKRGGKRSAEKEVTVAVLCPPEEYHEIGARMISDIFTIAGYNSTFVGANTPLDTFLEAMKELNPSYIAISVSNYYNLINKGTRWKIKNSGWRKGLREEPQLLEGSGSRYFPERSERNLLIRGG
jgi:methanogenic corrinoid protein MtbC1